MKLNDPGKRIDHVWLYTSIDGDDDEGVCAFRSGDTMLPMIASDERRRDILVDIAKLMVSEFPDMRIELRRFDGPAVVENVFGDGT